MKKSSVFNTSIQRSHATATVVRQQQMTFTLYFNFANQSTLFTFVIQETEPDAGDKLLKADATLKIELVITNKVNTAVSTI
jgi:hypothetical protein